MTRIGNDYIDVDLAYILGLIYGHGNIIERGDSLRISIEFSFKKKELEEVQEIKDIRNAIEISISKIRERIRETLGCEVRLLFEENSAKIILIFLSRNISYRIIREFTQWKSSYKNFIIPDYFFDAPIDILREFMIGISDNTGYIRSSNYDQIGRHRVYLQINNSNWYLPVQLCFILQRKLDIPVQLIQWGHPNTREPNKIDVNSDYTNWAREHQIKIHAEEFLKIGFNFQYKQKLVENLANENIKNFPCKYKNCNPLIKRPRYKKPKHPCENSDKLPSKIKGKHFNGYFEICLALGCNQGEKIEGEIEEVEEH